MKKLIVLTFLLLLAGCASKGEKEIKKAAEHIPEVREFVIQELEISDPQEVQFITLTEPAIKEVNSILYYWFKDKSGKAVYTVEAQSGKDFHIFEAKKN